MSRCTRCDACPTTRFTRALRSLEKSRCGAAAALTSTLARRTRGRNWTVPPLAPFWTPQRVIGQVRPFNDYPCVDLIVPAFSRKAVDALRNLLEPNGELLPLVAEVGEYFAYNITTVADILDQNEVGNRVVRGRFVHMYRGQSL